MFCVQYVASGSNAGNTLAVDGVLQPTNTQARKFRGTTTLGPIEGLANVDSFPGRSPQRVCQHGWDESKLNRRQRHEARARTDHFEHKKTGLWSNFSHQHEQTKTSLSVIARRPRLCTISDDVVDEYGCVAVLRSDCVMLTIQKTQQ